jgi:copper chaperone CopZ
MSDSIETQNVPIKGMHCKSCADKIANEVKQLDGVKDVKVDLLTDTATVTYDKSEVGLDAIKSSINKLGYEACDPSCASPCDDAPPNGDTLKDIPKDTQKSTSSHCAANKDSYRKKGSKDSGSSANASPNAKNDGTHKNTLIEGITYGLIPHLGCIAFIIGSVFGVTVLMQFFRPLLMNPNIFYMLIVVSILFATISAALYLKNNGMLSWAGARKKWKYLTTMYGTTVGINLLLFMVIFPMLASVPYSNSATAAAFVNPLDAGFNTLDLQVQIPCSGHAPLVTNELKTLPGIEGITFTQPNYFKVVYDPSQVTKAQILALEVFQNFKATVVGEQQATSSQNVKNGGSLAGTASPTAGGSAPSSGGTCGLSPSGSSGGCGGSSTGGSAAKTSGCGCGGGSGGSCGVPSSAPTTASPVTTNPAQDIYITALSSGQYDKPEVRVKKGELVRLHFTAESGSGCGAYMILDGFNVQLISRNGQEQVAEFTPTEAGTYAYHCGMWMFNGNLIVE